MDNINYKVLLQHCVNILDSHHYYTNKHLDVLINNNMNFYSEEELYKKYIANKKLMLKYLFDASNSNLKEEDYTIFVVLSYLFLFRIQELNYSKIKAFVDTQPTRKIYKLLEFIFSEKNLAPDGRLKMIWKDLLDENYIEKEILQPLRSVLHQNKKIMQYLEKKINLGMTVKKNTKVTKIKPFLLTKPKPRSFPEPKEIIYRKIKPTVLTDKVLNGSNDKKILEKKKEENRLRIMKRHEKEKENQFQIVKKSISKPPVEENPLPSPKFRSVKLPKFKPNNVKLNIATVLREEKLLQKQKMKKQSDLNNIEITLNSKNYEEWKNKIKAKEYEEMKLDELKKKFEIQLLHEDALDALEDVVKEKQEIVQQVKEQTEENKKIINETKKEQDKINKDFIRQVHNIEIQANEAKKKMTEIKKKNATEIKDESKEIQIQIQKQQEEELQKKAQLIKQIRLLEQYVMNYKPEIDLTETPNYGFLNEMSIVELKQRLALVKEAAKEEENRQRELILSRKKEKNLVLKKIRQNIENDRLIRTEQRIKNEKNKMERQKRLEDLLNEKRNVQTNEVFSLKSKQSTPTQNLDDIQSLYYELQQRKEQRQKRKYHSKKNKEGFIYMKSFSPNPRSSASSSKNKNLTNNRMENNTINLTLKSDKFVVIPNNKGQNSPSTLLPNVYQSIDESQFINIYNNNDKNDINKNQENDSSCSDLINSTYLISPEKSNDRKDYYTKKQLKLAEKNFEKKVNKMKYQEKLYNEELLKKQNEKKNMNVNFQLNEIKS
ncbi:hypothetical protein H8356DRAFT_928274 [Neocallimastix lanati (nom. inval.)]|nr:hypothetical protein H8356DRAFT_928274 [Neocallimastix sp. JGI-2020a]